MTALSFVWVHPYSQNGRCDILTVCFAYQIYESAKSQLTKTYFEGETLQLIASYTSKTCQNGIVLVAPEQLNTYILI